MNAQAYIPKREILEKKIIIVGAGIAGLSCAQHLIRYGFKNVILLEARDRIGGRIYSPTVGSHSVEMGAQWIHGRTGNVVYDLAKSHDLLDEAAIDYYLCIFEFDHLKSPNDLKVVKDFVEFLEEKMGDDTLSDSIIPLSVKLEKHFHDYLNNHSTNSDEERDLLEATFNWFCNLECELNGCCHLTNLSKNLLNTYRLCGGPQTIELKYNYYSIIEMIAQELPSNIIKTHKNVISINWSDFKSGEKISDSSVRVVCSDGDEFISDHVIITIPLGCLKSLSGSLFTPHLSGEKLKAISCLGFDTVNKIYLEFEKPFWEVGTVYNVLWTKSFYEKISLEKTTEERDCRSKWVKSISRFAFTPTHPKMLCAWVVGPGAVFMESLSDEECLFTCWEILSHLLELELPIPTNVIKTFWHSDPFTHGSYTYLSLECEKENVYPSFLAEPEYSDHPGKKHPVILFAGEATHNYYYSTVHGATKSGIREAERLFYHYQYDLRSTLRIAIIGAGIAGLACARELIKNHFANVTIYEAQEVAGGRISSLMLNDSVLELGAQWIHGRHSKLHYFAEENYLLSSNNPSYEGKGTFYSSSGFVIDNSLVAEIKTFLDSVKSDIESGRYDSVYTPKSVGDLFCDSFLLYLTSCTSDTRIRKGLFEWYMKFEMIDNASNDLKGVATQSYSKWAESSDESYYINFKNGFKSITDSLCLELPSSITKLKKAVKSVNWMKAQSLNYCNKEFFINENLHKSLVELKFEDEEIKTDIVIITASAGFLKDNVNSFFYPPLPDAKLNAISTLGFGTVNKIYLIFEEPFWNEGNLGFQLIWTEPRHNTELQTLLKNNPWLEGISGFDVVRNQPNVLLGWVCGPEAEQCEDVDDEIISDACIHLLQIFLNVPLPKPKKIYRSAWKKNPYIRGGYSNLTLDFIKSGGSVHTLQSPLSVPYFMQDNRCFEFPVVMFAGEATDECGFSSAHGAFESGCREAESILAAVSKIEGDGTFQN